MPATAFCCLMKLTSRPSGSTKASSQMPRSPTVPQPRRSTLVDSTTTRPAPPAANLPAFIRCQSVGKPFTAEYWCIGGTTMRFFSFTSRIENGENSINPNMVHFPHACSGLEVTISASAWGGKPNPDPPIRLCPRAMQFWDGVTTREAIGERKQQPEKSEGEEPDERSDPASAQCRAWGKQRAVPEPARIRPQGASQPQPERLGLHRRRRRDRDHDAPQPHGARRDRIPPARAQ